MYTDPFEILQKSAPTAPKDDIANTSNIVPGVTKGSGMEQSNASKQSSKYKRKYHEYINILLLHYFIFINLLFFSGHDQDAKSLQGENPAGVASGGDDETETETDAPENSNIMGPSTNTTTTVLPRYYYNLIIT